MVNDATDNFIDFLCKTGNLAAVEMCQPGSPFNSTYRYVVKSMANHMKTQKIADIQPGSALMSLIQAVGHACAHKSFIIRRTLSSASDPKRGP